mgnify:CR=1 FL=1
MSVPMGFILLPVLAGLQSIVRLPEIGAGRAPNFSLMASWAVEQGIRALRYASGRVGDRGQTRVVE